MTLTSLTEDRAPNPTQAPNTLTPHKCSSPSHHTSTPHKSPHSHTIQVPLTLTPHKCPSLSHYTSDPHPHTTQGPSPSHHTSIPHKNPHSHTIQVPLTLIPHKCPSPSHHTRAPTLTPHKSPHPHTTQEPSPSHHTSRPTFLPGAPLASSRNSSSSLSERLRALRAMCLALCLMEWSFGLLPPLLCWTIKQRWISDSRDWEGGGVCVCVCTPQMQKHKQ